MKKFTLVCALCLAVCCGITCCGTEKPKKQTPEAQNGMELIVEPGEYWLTKMRVFIFSVNKTPQMAVWIEEDGGKYVRTITVSEKTLKGNWRSAPRGGRPEALPVWNRRRQNDPATHDLDALSSASVKGPFAADISKEPLVDGKRYSVFLEINHSFDYNDHWTEANSGVNGQPSLVYHAHFAAGQEAAIPLAPIGHGSVDGSDGNIAGGVENCTTALGIVRAAYVIVK